MARRRRFKILSRSTMASFGRGRRLLFWLVAIRLVNAWWLATFFQPDEYFQCLEPAWALAFGPRSGAWLTWVRRPPRSTASSFFLSPTPRPAPRADPPNVGAFQEWHHRLRSSLHPALFSAAYAVADRLASALLPAGAVAPRTTIVMAAPRALQALIAALGDWFTWRLAVTIYGPHTGAASFALLLQLVNPWQWYVSTRTFSNSLETTLTAMALCCWPWRLLGGSTAAADEKPPPLACRAGLRAALCLAALATVLRPTNVLIWAVVGPVTVARLVAASPARCPADIASLVREALLCAGLVVGLALVADRLYYGVWTFPPLNWLLFNVHRHLAVFYGRNPWHYYLLQGLPLLCTTSLPFALWGLWAPSAASAHQARVLGALGWSVVGSVVALSLIAHKEVRFLYPLLPALNVLAAPRAAAFFTAMTTTTTKTVTAARPRPRLRHRRMLAAGLTVNLVLALFLSLAHQPAPLRVLAFLRHQYERLHPSAAPDDELFVLFLTPCHSTPWRSHLVYPGLRATALTCEPPLHTTPGSPARAAYRDEADRFYADPGAFLRRELVADARRRPPRYIVAFEALEPSLRRLLDDDDGDKAARRVFGALRPVWVGFNGFFNEDTRRRGRLLVWDTGFYDDVAPP